MTSGSLVSTSNVCSWPTDLAGSPSWTGSGSTPASAIDERRAVLAEPAHDEVGRERREVADRPHRVVAQRHRGLVPDTPQPPDRERGEEGRLLAQRHDDQPVGLLQVRRDLGDELGAGDPDRGGQPDLGPDVVLDPAGDGRAVAEQDRGPGHVEERLVDRDRLDQRRVAPEDGHDVAAGGLVATAIDRQEDGVRTAPVRLAQRHRGVDAEATGFVARGRDDTAAVLATRPPDDDRQATQLGPVALLHGGEERVEIDMQDGSRGHVAIIDRCGTPRGRRRHRAAERRRHRRGRCSPSSSAASSPGRCR